jgi:glycosyl transferase, family 25
MKTFLISLPNSYQRRSESIDILNGRNIDFEVVDGVDLSDCLPCMLPCTARARIDRLVGEVGCYAAHLRALRRIVDDRLSCACILEDDIKFEDWVDRTPQQYFEEAPSDFHYIHLGRKYMPHAGFRIMRRLGNYFQVREQPIGAFAYIITRPLAQYVLARHALCDLPIDILYNQLSHHGNFYMPDRLPIGIRGHNPSTIRGTTAVRDLFEIA